MFAAIVLVALSPTFVHAADELIPGRWYATAEAGLNLTQAAYSDNWRGGENSSLAWSSVLSATARRRFHNSVEWNNVLKLRFGQQYQQSTRSDGSRRWSAPEKSEDKIDFESIGLISRDWKVDPYVSGRFASQFLDVSDPNRRSVPINPITVRESAGVAKLLLQNKDESVLVRFGFTGRQNYRRLFIDPVSTTKEGKFTNDSGIELQGDWRLRILENRVVWVAKASIYKPFSWSEADKFDRVAADSLASAGIARAVNDFSTAVDVSWENEFTTEVTRWVSFSLYVELVWDKYDNSVTPILNAGGNQIANAAAVHDAIRQAVQWKQSFAAGLTFHLL